MAAIVVSVSVSMPRMVKMGDMEWLTAIMKEPGAGPIYVDMDGPVGNKSAVHPEAVYAIGVEAYDYWAERLGANREEWQWGRWGENITFSGLFEKDLKIGDILEVGSELVMQVSSARNPCVKLSWRLGQPASVLATLIESGVMGFYLRVLKPGMIKAGDAVTVRSPHPENMAVIDLPRLIHNKQASSESVRAALEMPALSDYPKMFLRQRLSQALDAELTQANRWEGWRVFSIQNIVDESEDVRSFSLIPVDGQPVAAFRPGQFLTFLLPIGPSGKLIRQWSISDYARDPLSYRISVKRQTGGLASNWLHDNATVGMELSVKAPAGRFVLDSGSPKPIVLISAGIGITPLLAMLKAHSTRASGKAPPAVWIHGTRNSKSYALRSEVDAVLQSGIDVKQHTFFSRPGADDVLGRDYHHTGRPTPKAIKKIVENIRVELATGVKEIPGQICEFYICGPEDYQNELKKELADWGVDANVIRTESFAGRKAPGADSIEQSEVFFAASGITATWQRDDGQTLLELAEAVGIEAPNNCRLGACHSCVCRVVKGSVEHLVEPEGLDKSQVIICSAVPSTSHLQLDL